MASRYRAAMASEYLPAKSTTVRMVVGVATTAVVVRTLVNDLIPDSIKDSAAESISQLFSRWFSNTSTVVIDEYRGYATNYMFKAAEGYLGSNLPVSTLRLKVSKEDENNGNMNITMDRGEEITDMYEGKIACKWTLVYHHSTRNHSSQQCGRFCGRPAPVVRCYELSFHREHREVVLNRYLPYVLAQWRSIKELKRSVKIHAADYDEIYPGNMDVWTGLKLDHPATFQTLAMEPEMKREVIEDLDRFVKRKEYYRKVGKPWKRGYLLYGPPGTGKSTMIAAMANYLKFSIYDLDLSQVQSNSDLRTLLMATANKSLLVVEDVDCCMDLQNRSKEVEEQKDGDGDDDGNDDGKAQRRKRKVKVTLSGLLNLLDGLWSSRGAERIIVFTTNYRDRLDPALLRPGRMDMHIHMSYCTPASFRELAFNYHSILDHHLLGDIDRLIVDVQATPAELAEELLRSDNVEEALRGVITLLEEKRSHIKEHVAEEASLPYPSSH